MGSTVGWGYGMWREDLAKFVAWRDDHSKEWIETHCDDDPINEWVSETKRLTWHPLPTIVDHDQEIASTHPDPWLGNFSTCTWRDSSFRSELMEPEYWDSRVPPFPREMPSEEKWKGLKEGYWR